MVAGRAHRGDRSDAEGAARGDVPAAGRRRQRGRRPGQHHGADPANRCSHNLARLFRYRGLIQSLVARELKARYRGSVLGFFWSFINPLLLLLVYSFVFTSSCRRRTTSASSRTRCSCSAACCRGRGFRRRCSNRRGALISGGNLIKKVLFPAEILPIVTVLANMVHFFLGLLILAGVPGVLPAAAHDRRARLVSGRRARAVDLHARAAR